MAAKDPPDAPAVGGGPRQVAGSHPWGLGSESGRLNAKEPQLWETGALAGSQDKEEFKMVVCPQQQGPVIRNGTESQSMELEQNDFNFLQLHLEKWLHRGPGEGACRV